MQPIDDARAFLRDLSKALKHYSEQGLNGYDCSTASLERMDRWPSATNRGGRFQSPETLEAIEDDLFDCRRCKLHEKRQRIVFGTGSPHAPLMFVGEGPGREEDQKGEPFVGAAGQLLTKIIEAIHLTRESVYICNIVKCRPHNNRNPHPDEIETCLPFLKRQIAAVGPQFIVSLGSVATQTLLNTNRPISRLRGRFHELDGGIRLLPTYHPAYLLRNPEKKRDVWEDMKLLMQVYPYDP
jgi:DNA polymerase